MDRTILIGGAAGQGMDTLAAALERHLKRKGFFVFTVRDYMSRIRGGHNFLQVRFGTEGLCSHCDELDCIVALNEETLTLHRNRLKPEGIAVADEETALALVAGGSGLVGLPLRKIAKELGNPRVFGSVAIGAVLGLYGISLDGLDEVFQDMFSVDAAALNFTAAQRGFELAGTAKYRAFAPATSTKPDEPDEAGRTVDTAVMEEDRLLINGNEAVALGALAAGCRFYSAYPMTPSTSIMNYLAGKMLDAQIVVEQAEDEIAAINMAIGASYAGARAMTGTSGGGFCLMVEALGLAGMMELPLVVADVQRPGPVTGFPTRTEQGDLKFVISASHGEFPRMVIALKNPEDAFRQTIRAFDLADRYQLPVILLSDQFLSDTTVTTPVFDFSYAEERLAAAGLTGIREKEAAMAGLACIPDGQAVREAGREEDRAAGLETDGTYRRYEVTESGISPRLVPGRTEGVTITVDSDEHDEFGHITESAEVRVQQMNKRLRKLEFLKKELQEPEYIGADECDTLLLAWGSSWGPIKEAIRLLNTDDGKKYGALVFGDIWPLPDKLLREKAAKASKLINVEQNATGQLASLVSENTGLFCSGSVLKYDGRAMNARYIYSKVKEGEQAHV